MLMLYIDAHTEHPANTNKEAIADVFQQQAITRGYHWVSLGNADSRLCMIVSDLVGRPLSGLVAPWTKKQGRKQNTTTRKDTGQSTREQKKERCRQKKEAVPLLMLRFLLRSGGEGLGS